MLGFYEKIFDIKFVKVVKPDSASVWHEDVQQYAIYQNVKTKGKELEFMGWIYFDLHPREGKYGHAANFGLGPDTWKRWKTRHTPITVLVCNFTKPSKDKPSLLKHDEVTTFFHDWATESITFCPKLNIPDSTEHTLNAILLRHLHKC